jgi:type 1 glutamine amidotransferase
MNSDGDRGAPRKLLAVTGGHPFDRESFIGMLESMRDVAWCHAEHPAATANFDPERSADFAAFLCYDMPGLSFKPGTNSGYRGVDYVAPPAFLVDGMGALLRAGKPLIFLHHALAGWPSWDGYERIVGGRFLYRRDPARGLMDSGYRHAVRHRVHVVCDHPITRGLGDGFEIEDELYLIDVDETDKLPLLRSTHDFSAAGFYSAHEAVMNDRLFCNEGWQRPAGSTLVAWAKCAGNSPVVYIQCGDGASAHGNPAFRLLLQNTIDWITSKSASAWALAPWSDVGTKIAP